MSEAMSLFLIGSSILAGTVIPGPSFLVVFRAGLLNRKQGILVAIGVGLASVLFAGLALAGLLVVLAQTPSLYLALKIIGGAYLCYLSWRFWRAASLHDGSISTKQERSVSLIGCLTLGFATQGANPKAALVYASTFAAFLPPDPEIGLSIFVVLMIFCISVGWYGAVAIASSTPTLTSFYSRARVGIERTASLVIGAMGVAIIYNAVTERLT